MQIIGGTINGGTIQDLSDLYAFSTFLFTNGNAQGRTGPTLAGLLATYSNVGNSWITSTAYLDVQTQGIQLWTVPHTGTYEITAAGAGGGYNTKHNLMGGNGAIVTNQVSLNRGQQLAIVVGQRGSNCNAATAYSGGGGGGGSFVYDNSTITYYTVAGGGGGAASATAALLTTQANAHANAFSVNGGSITGSTTFRANGGRGGQGGNVEIATRLLTGAAGAGILTSGQDGQTYTGTQQWGGTRANNWVGGNTYTTFGVPGGFGGGGIAGETSTTYYTNNTYIWAGGGGGYSGGAAGFNTRAGDGQYAGGGGSYPAGTFISGVTGGNFGNGYVQITKIN